jgi:small-conductance mechanosensitive channel
VGLNQIRIEESRRALRSIKRVLDRLMSARDTTALPPEQQQAIRADLRTLVKDQRRLLDRLGEAYTSYLQALGDVDFVHKQLVDKMQQYALFLNERLLWIPSSRPVGFATLHNLVHATAWILSPLRWAQTSETLVAAALRAPIVMIPVLLVFGALLSIRCRTRLTLEAIAERVSKPYSDRFVLTTQALGLIVLVAAPWPIFLSFLGWRLQAPVEASAFSRTVGAALLQLAPALFLFYTFYLVCRPKGIAELHFGWQEQALTLFRRHLPWLMAIVLPAVFVTSLAGWETEEVYRDSLGRLAFIISLLAFAVFLQRLLQPNHQSADPAFAADGDRRVGGRRPLAHLDPVRHHHPRRHTGEHRLRGRCRAGAPGDARGRACPSLVMPDPEPAVVIAGFAEGAINFEVRVFVKELGHRVPVDHELRLRIHDALCTHHIQTPLPERNVHVRSFVSTLQAPNRRSEPPEGDRLPTFGPPARGEGK